MTELTWIVLFICLAVIFIAWTVSRCYRERVRLEARKVAKRRAVEVHRIVIHQPEPEEQNPEEFEEYEPISESHVGVQEFMIQKREDEDGNRRKY